MAEVTEALVQKAREIATKAHAGQVDKSGKPYIHHPEMVASLVDTPAEKCVAWLHDTLEDTNLTEGQLRPVFGDEITDAVVLMTHPDGVPYMDYIYHLAPNPLARKVKMADLTHNMDTGRFEGKRIPEHLIWKRENCYLPAYQYLKEYDAADDKF